MLDVDQRTQKGHPSSLAEWAYRAIGIQRMRLRTRLRGNNLHILCESTQCPEAAKVLPKFLRALKATNGIAGLPIDLGQPIYHVILYGRTLNRQRPDWVEAIDVHQLDRHLERWHQPSGSNIGASNTPNSGSAESQKASSGLIVSNESLARSGQPEAIARYLSETLSPLGVGVNVFIQKLPTKEAVRMNEEKDENLIAPSSYIADPCQARCLWVICNSDYSPDASLLAEPVAQRLRDLNLEGFSDAVIRSQVSGEANPDWVLRIDLTPPEEMLSDWARWGDVQAIARLLNQALAEQKMEVRAVLKGITLHLFCGWLPNVAMAGAAPDKQAAIEAIAPMLESLAPQGIQAVTIYGVEVSRHLEASQESPVWIEWLNLPASIHPALAPNPLTLAQQGDEEALIFLLQRLINPDLDQRLATGGIHVTIRRQQDLLHIMSEAPTCPSQSQVGDSIVKFIRQLAIPEIAGVRVYGRIAGQTSPLWSYGSDFARTKRRQPEATPEFATSYAYANNLLLPASELVGGEDFTKEDVKGPLKRTAEGVGRKLQHLLCYTQLFIPTTETKDLTLVPARSANTEFHSSSQEAIAEGGSSLRDAARTTIAQRVAKQRIAPGIWGAVGLLLTVQADWLMGYWLRSSPEAAAVAPVPPPSPATDSGSELLPQLSLQKSRLDKNSVFNASGFTSVSDNSKIANNQHPAANSFTSPRPEAPTAAILAAAKSSNPSFNNPLLDEKLALYQHACSINGPADILIVGSSRAMRGIDPKALQTALAAQGYPKVEVFNFGINGATVQVVDLIVRRILTPSQLPKLIIWADGARAFNSGRVDQTYNAIATSPGAKQLSDGSWDNRSGSKTASQTEQSLTASYEDVNESLNQVLANISSTYPQREQLMTRLQQQYAQMAPTADIAAQAKDSSFVGESPVNEGDIDVDGFLPLSIRFQPSTYYQQHAKVTGDYDSDYESFQLDGEQNTALQNLLQFVQAQKIPLVFVNVPLTNNYLDPVRKKHEAKFQQHMQQIALQKQLIFQDLTQLWPTKYDRFSDPSHLNRYGAEEVSKYLGQDKMIPWPNKEL
ncbi:MAG: DUF1574 family protein [Aphanothece sp. CMT-3BRIN-NPC111]|jgi:hypothetical protein|nr:DUF1574 family protein [Aphanothece sp. CMT-3BRIN-NPC111]